MFSNSGHWSENTDENFVEKTIRLPESIAAYIESVAKCHEVTFGQEIQRQYEALAKSLLRHPAKHFPKLVEVARAAARKVLRSVA